MNATVEEFAALSGIYRLLGRLWQREVDEQLLAGLLEPPIRDVFLGAGGNLPERRCPETLETLAVEYCRLFLGPSNHLPPFQSVWQRGQFQSQPAQSMGRYATIAGYESSESMLDHLGIQLEVMGYLLDTGIELKWPAEELRALVATYYAEHLAWPARLLQSAIERADTDFYRSMVGMTRDFLDSEAETWLAKQP